MKRFFLPLLLSAVWINCFGQPVDAGLQKERKGNHLGQTPVQLFQPAKGNLPSIARPALSDYEILQPSIDEMERLYAAAPHRFLLSIPGRNGAVTILELERTTIMVEDFAVELRRGGRWTGTLDGLHYRGRIAGDETSLAAISIFPGEASGFWSAEKLGGNWVLGPWREAGSPNAHLLYFDKGIVFNPAFACAMKDDGQAYTAADLRPAPRGKGKGGPCIELFWEIDYDVFVDKGGAQGAVRYMTSLFNQVAAVLAQDGIATRLARLYLWNTPSVYNGATVERQLQQFQETRLQWQGNLAQLLSYKVNGGVAAGFAGLCGDVPAKSMSYAGIASSFSSLPNYSWTVNVVAHELGHLMGARHTHACAWNGDGTSIDDCGNIYMVKQRGEPEGATCFAPDQPKYPEQGGTLMSYCHLLDGVGVNLSKGFHEQPLAVIRNKMAGAACLEVCTPEAIFYECVGNALTLALTLDDFGSETTWKLRDQNGLLLYEGGPYPDGRRGERIEETLCLGPGCFTLEMFDAYDDGMCCYYGQGAYALSDTGGVLLASGGRFGDVEKVSFCLPVEEASPPSDRDNCQRINFNDVVVNSYGGTQDVGDYEVRDEGAALRLWGNAWKSIPLDYEISPFTILEFEFGATAQAEIHAIGLDDDEAVSFNRTFKLFGTQNWGILPYFNYGYPGEWMSFSIPVGLHYQGPVRRLFFCVDDDEAPVNGDSWFRNIRLYESGDCLAELTDHAGGRLTGPAFQPTLRVFPNPARNVANILLFTSDNGSAEIQMLNMTGQVLKRKTILLSEPETREKLTVDDLPAGIYLLKVAVGTEILLQKLILTGSGG